MHTRQLRKLDVGGRSIANDMSISKPDAQSAADVDALLHAIASTAALSPDGWLVIDGQSRVRLWNAWLERRSGIAADQAHGRQLAELPGGLVIAEAVASLADEPDAARRTVDAPFPGPARRLIIWARPASPGSTPEAGLTVIRLVEAPLESVSFENVELSPSILAGVLNTSMTAIMVFRSIRNEQGMIEDFEMLMANPAAAATTGRPLEELVGTRLSVEFPGTRRTGLIDRYVRVVESGEPTIFEHRYEFPGENIDAWFNIAAVKLGDGFVLSFDDITERKLAETELSKINWLISTKPGPPDDVTVIRPASSAGGGRVLETVNVDVIRAAIDDDLRLLETAAIVHDQTGRPGLIAAASDWAKLLLGPRAAESDARIPPSWSQPACEAIGGECFVEHESDDGMQFCAVPIHAQGRVVGAVSLALGGPPTDPKKLAAVHERTGVSLAELQDAAQRYETRPHFIIEVARARVRNTAKLLGEMVERRLAELDASTTRTFLASTIDSLSAHLAILDAHGRIAMVNEAWRRFARDNGFQGEDAGVGVDYIDLCRTADGQQADQVHAIAEGLQQLLRGEADEFSIEYPCHSPTEHRWFVLRATPFHHDGSIWVVIVHVNVTDIKQAEDALREANEALRAKNEELSQFANIASHELQEPLRMIGSYLQLIEARYGQLFDERGSQYLQYATDGAKRLSDLITALLTYARVGTRGRPAEQVDCNQLLEQVLRDLSVAIEQAEGVVTADPLPTVWADPIQWRQVFQNLIGNALKFHGDKPARVHMTAQERFGQWVFAVHDEGIGLDPAQADQIFQLFRRLRPRRETPGTGVGLAVCRKIIERHGGRIWVESEPEHGATFFFTLPMRQVAEDD